MNVLSVAGHCLLLIPVLLAVAAGGRRLARLLRQPPVIGEIVAGLVLGPLVLAAVGRELFGVLLPGEVRDVLRLVAEGALALFLAGLARELRAGPVRLDRRLGWISAGALVPPLLAGTVVGVWVLHSPGQVRGDAPGPALILFMAIALSITAVPVLARLLAERGLSESTAGTLALAAAIVIDIIGWLLLSLAVAMGSGDAATFRDTLAVFAAALVSAALVRRLLAAGAVRRWCGRWPVAATAGLGVIVLAIGGGVHALGLTAVFGGIIAGLGIPPGAPWERPVATVSRAGKVLLPVFFVNTGLTVLTGTLGATSWALVVVVLALGIIGKIGGGYLGGRLGGCPPGEATRIGILLNTRGLTELIVLQVGYQAGILSPPLYLALLIMALVTTAMTGPLLSLADRVSPVAARERA